MGGETCRNPHRNLIKTSIVVHCSICARGEWDWQISFTEIIYTSVFSIYEIFSRKLQHFYFHLSKYEFLHFYSWNWNDIPVLIFLSKIPLQRGKLSERKLFYSSVSSGDVGGASVSGCSSEC